MVFNTLTVGVAVTPTVIETWISHYLNRKSLHEKPTAHISYHVGLQLVRRFLTYASHHTVEDIQTFTAQHIPTPHWIRIEEVAIPEPEIRTAAKHVNAQLGPQGINDVGGPTWWQWRQDPLRAEWIEMRKDYLARQQEKEDSLRCMLYVHGGAYYFGSVDEHRYQMQRHARKLNARVLAPRYRLAPQYPFPCGLLDCLAAYLHLLSVQPPETIILAGDSAGGGMVMALLVVLRDQGIPLPAGAILLSPWVDLTHSFPSVAGWNDFDYVPPHGFVHRPSLAWPPPNADDIKALQDLVLKGADVKKIDMNDLREQIADNTGKDVRNVEQEGGQGFAVEPATSHDNTNPLPGVAPNLSIMFDDKIIEIKDQIQIYAPNHLLSHPLVSPVLQPSLGGLPPMLILVGGGEMLRDEQIFLAHKAAAPASYPPSPEHLAAQGPHATDEILKWPPTNVQLQIWDDLCHVAPTLSFTRPAKYMYRSIAQFGAWALARAQKKEINILDDDEISIISTSSSASETRETPAAFESNDELNDIRDQIGHMHRRWKDIDPRLQAGAIGTAGAPLPPFIAHMIRQRVTRHGIIYPLAPASSLPACIMTPSDVGVIKPGPVRKWLSAQQEWARSYAREKRVVQAHRVAEMRKMAVEGNKFGTYGKGESPPPTALVGRCGEKTRKANEKSKKKRVGGWALKIWTGWGSRHDEDAIERKEVKEKEDEKRRTSLPSVVGGSSMKREKGASAMEDRVEMVGPSSCADDAIVGAGRARSRSRMKSIVDERQIQESGSAMTSAVDEEQIKERPYPTIELPESKRPALGGQRFPFKLGLQGENAGVNASMVTLTSTEGIIPTSAKAASEESEPVRPEPQRFVTARELPE